MTAKWTWIVNAARDGKEVGFSGQGTWAQLLAAFKRYGELDVRGVLAKRIDRPVLQQRGGTRRQAPARRGVGGWVRAAPDGRSEPRAGPKPGEGGKMKDEEIAIIITCPGDQSVGIYGQQAEVHLWMPDDAPSKERVRAALAEAFCDIWDEEQVTVWFPEEYEVTP